MPAKDKRATSRIPIEVKIEAIILSEPVPKKRKERSDKGKKRWLGI